MRPQARFARSRRDAVRLSLGICLGICLFPALRAVAADEPRLQAAKHPNAEQESFFELKVRPLLVARCFRCHGEKLQKGGIRLDSAEALLGKSNDDALVKPGHPEESRLIEVIGYKDEPKMPPDGKLLDSDAQILREWVRRGAHFPASANGAAPVRLSSPEGIVRAKQTLWSLQPVRSPIPPRVKHSGWVQTTIDQFVLAKLEANGLTPSAAVDRRTLLRRMTFDLTGLPPTFAEVRAFENDRSPAAVEKVVDRLLASPHYGERWGRHWLDVARYSDTKGYVFTEERRYPFSYTYRDYVIDAFNDDLPFNRFVLEQLAADQLDLGNDHSALAAMGFLTVGRRFSNNMNDIIDDRIDVVSRGLLGLAVTCAGATTTNSIPFRLKTITRCMEFSRVPSSRASCRCWAIVPSRRSTTSTRWNSANCKSPSTNSNRPSSSRCRINSVVRRLPICKAPGTIWRPARARNAGSTTITDCVACSSGAGSSISNE